MESTSHLDSIDNYAISQIAWSLLPRLVRSCAIIDQRRVRGLTLRARIAAGLTTASTERTLASGRPMEVSRLRITGAGRRALVEAAEDQREAVVGGHGSTQGRGPILRLGGE
jgi:hypothetical protein